MNNERSMGQKFSDKAEEYKLKAQAKVADVTGDKRQELQKGASAKAKEVSNDVKAEAEQHRNNIKKEFH